MQNNPSPDLPPNPRQATTEQQVKSRIARVLHSDRYAIAAFHLEGDRIFLNLDLQNFPHADFPTAQRMLREEFARILREATATAAAEKDGPTDAGTA